MILEYTVFFLFLTDVRSLTSVKQFHTYVKKRISVKKRKDFSNFWKKSCFILCNLSRIGWWFVSKLAVTSHKRYKAKDEHITFVVISRVLHWWYRLQLLLKATKNSIDNLICLSRWRFAKLILLVVLQSNKKQSLSQRLSFLVFFLLKCFAWCMF